MAIFEVACERKIVKKRGILAAHMYMENIGSTPRGVELLPIIYETVLIHTLYISIIGRGV